MSIFSSVRKVFRKVVKTVKRIAPYVLLAAAVVFTAGAALAAAGAAAGTMGTAAAAGQGIFGWSTALSGAIAGPGGILAGSPVLASVITGAITQGIIGTAIGGTLALATGKDITKGMLLGGIGGLVTGGVTGFVTAPPAGLTAPGTTAAGDITGRAPIGAPITRTAAPELPSTTAQAPRIGLRTPTANLPGGLSAEDLIFAPATQGPAPATQGIVGRQGVIGAAGVAGKTGLAPNISLAGAATETPWGKLDALGRLTRVWDNTVNTRLGSAAVVGGVTALLSGGDETGRVEAARIDAETLREERAAIAANFGGTAGLLTQGTAQPFVPNLSAPLAGGRWFWNPETRRLDYQQAQVA